MIGKQNNTVTASSIDQTEQKKALSNYWNTHPIATDSVPYEPGTRESYEAIYAKYKRETDQMRLDFLEDCRGKKVLEVGCGIGMDSRFLTENGIDHYGLDYSFRSLQLAKKHFDLNQLRKRFTNADAVSLPFASNEFGLVMSIGVIHHIIGTPEACRELIRVCQPGGIVRVMFYNQNSYHYALVNLIVRPLIWLMLRLRFLEAFLSFAPSKFKHMYQISKEHGFSKQLLLAISADTSFAGTNNFIPKSGFWTESEMRALFDGLEDFHFIRSDLRYFPLPFLRRFVEKRWGFFLTMIARKPKT
ncbi:MAG TPA: class I SAM-dependent methyltransferase [Pyrinomonadaceae bacterium]|nr:class I SAM-dependent methyltransferase [Pyrinomonadaceae bacterium]